MKIGSALKSIRLSIGLNQTQMAAGVVTESYYSKVERGLHNLDADALIEILRAHNLSFQTFANAIEEGENAEKSFKVKSTDDTGLDYYDLSAKMSAAQNARDRKGLDEVKEELEKVEQTGKTVPEYVKLYLKKAYSFIDRNGNEFTPEEKAMIKKDMFKHTHYDMLTPYTRFQMNLWVLDFEDMYNAFNQIIRGYKKVKDPGTTLIVMAGATATCFLARCKEEKVDKKYTKSAIDFLRSFDYIPWNFNALLMGAYFEAYFNGEKEKAKEIYKSYDYIKEFIGNK